MSYYVLSLPILFYCVLFDSNLLYCVLYTLLGYMIQYDIL